MKKPRVQQRTERRISAALRLVLVAVLLAAQLALVFLLSTVLKQRAALAYTILELLAFVCGVYIWTKPGTTSYKVGWIFLILFLPVVGLILYWLWNGGRQSKRLDLKKLPPPQEPGHKQEESRLNVEKLRQTMPQWAPLAAYLNNKGFPLYRNTAATYLPTGKAFLEDMLDAMEQAERFIFLEYFIMAEGEIWDRLTDILRRKSGQGVEVKLIFDDFGSMMRMPAEEVEALRRAGVEVIVFNPVHHYVNRLYFNYRDHRKITCVDGDTAYTGGANLADEYADIIRRFGYWKDCGIRLEGEGAWGLTREFIYMWERLGGEFHSEHDYYRPMHHALSDGFCQTVVDGPDNNPDATAEDVFLQMISRARQTVYITTPYLAIDEPMIKALCLAGDSGVDVRLMMPGIPDHKFAYQVAQSYFPELTDHGVKIYTYTPGLIHGKTVMVDREAAFVGSVNMDFRSFQLHFECGELLYRVPAIESLLEDMDDIMAHSEPVTPARMAARPWYLRVVGVVLRLFAMWM